VKRVFNERGYLSVEFLIIGLMVVFMAFMGTDIWMLEVKQQACTHIASYYFDRIRVTGYLTEADEAEMFDKFAEAGCDIEDADGDIIAPREVNGDSPVSRGTEITFKVILRPQVEPFTLGRLIGVDPLSDFKITVGGRGLSEYTP